MPRSLMKRMRKKRIRKDIEMKDKIATFQHQEHRLLI